MAYKSYENPNEIKDEEKWLKIFSTDAFKWLLVTGVIGIVLFNLFNSFGKGIIGIILGGIQCIFFTGIQMIYMPREEYMKGGGLTLAVLLKRIIHRKLNKRIYVKYMIPEVSTIMKKEKLEENRLKEKRIKESTDGTHYRLKD